MSHRSSKGQAVAGDPGRSLNKMILEGRSFSSHERNCCFLNTGSASIAASRFANISAVSGLDFADDGRAVALVDWDQDGDLDMWISNRNAPRLRLMRNDVPNNHHFVALRLEGDGKTTNRDAIGARVEIVYANSDSENRAPKSIKTLRAGEGFLAQSSKWLHFGLGAADVIERVTVRWPGGDVEQFGGIDADHRYRLIQGSGTARDITPLSRKTKLVRSTQKALPSTQVARIPLVDLLVMPKSHYQGFDGRERDLPAKSGRLLLMNLWASWCGPCANELSEFSKRYEELQAKGIDVLALSVNGLGDDASTKEDAARLASARKFPFPVGLATSTLVKDFQELHNLHLPLHGKLPLPSSFLIDRQGRLAVIYKGPLSVGRLLEDSERIEGNRIERFERFAPIVGRSIRHRRVEHTATNSALDLRLFLARYLEESGRADQAAKQYLDVLKISSSDSIAHHNLGMILLKQGKATEAINHLQLAVRGKSDYAEAHNSLGIALHGQGKVVEAARHFRQALQIKPDYADAHNSLGITLHGQGKIVEAIEHYHQAMRIDPHYVAAHRNLGLTLQELSTRLLGQSSTGNVVEPNHAVVHAHLGDANRDQGDVLAAVQHYQWALDLKPDHPSALNNLAWIRATHPDAKLRDGAQAVELAERCCKLSGYQLGTTLDTLAAAYAEAGRFDDAIKWQTKAVELAPATGKGELQTRLELYKAGKPYRDR